MYALDQPCKLQRLEAVGVSGYFVYVPWLLWAAWGNARRWLFLQGACQHTTPFSVTTSSSNPPEVMSIAEIAMLQAFACIVVVIYPTILSTPDHVPWR
jgi:hypothetical protein